MAEHTVVLPQTSAQTPASNASRGGLFIASFLALFFELIVIRYLGSEIRIFAYLMNLSLIAAFAGLGLGMILGRPPVCLLRAFPLVASTLLLIISYAERLHLTHLPFPNVDYLVWTTFELSSAVLAIAEYELAVLTILLLVFAFFIVLGGFVGEQFRGHSSTLSAYGVNLAGSLAGIAVFSLLSFLGTPPAVWLFVGCAGGFHYYRRKPLVMALFVIVIGAIAMAPGKPLWSPYYRITVKSMRPPAGATNPASYVLSVNHDYHQKIVDLSERFVREHPDAEPNRSALSTYELPYRLYPRPKSVLVIGAGTGNDVAAALRHGAAHVDAVEIDPVIYRLGTEKHPERPYSSDRVTVFLDDARAFLKRTGYRYDLIVFGYLDAHTMVSSFSSIRLDNYVYTVDSFREARSHLNEGGAMVLAFGSGKTFISARLFRGLKEAFGEYPRAFSTGYDESGMVFVEGARGQAATEFPDVTAELLREAKTAVVPTDDWPFLYLRSRSIPVAIAMIVLPFLLLCTYVVELEFGLGNLRRPAYIHVFLLGAGFMLLEASGVTRLSLLFGSTWIVNAVVIGAFIVMALLANALVIKKFNSYAIGYAGLLVSLAVNSVFRVHSIDALPTATKILCAGLIVGSPVFFSGLIFSRALLEFDVPARAMGMNLLGAVVGGAIENVVMVTGISALPGLALAVYGLSAIALRHAKKSPVVDPVSDRRYRVDTAGA